VSVETKEYSTQWIHALSTKNQKKMKFMKQGTTITSQMYWETHKKNFRRAINSVVLVRKRTIPTERPQPVDEVSANFSR
jgi:hypothetical protein